MFSSRPHLHKNITFKVIIIAKIQEDRNKYLEYTLEKINHCEPGNYPKRWEYAHLIGVDTIMPIEYCTDAKIISKKTHK